MSQHLHSDQRDTKKFLFSAVKVRNHVALRTHSFTMHTQSQSLISPMLTHKMYAPRKFALISL